MDSRSKPILIIVLLMIMTLVSTSILMEQEFHPISNIYFRTNKYGQISQLPPLDKPYTNPQDVEDWMENSLLGALNINFEDYRYFLRRQSHNFSDRAWTFFIEQLKSAPYFVSMLNSDDNLVTTASSPPVLVNSGVVNGVYTWRFTVPLKIQDMSVSGGVTYTYDVEVLVRRCPVNVNPSGYVISYILIDSKTS